MSKAKQSYYQDVRQKIDVFARRFYVNSLLQNLAIFLAASISLLLIISLIELSVKNDSNIRAFIFFSFLTSIVFGFIYMVVLPGLKAMGWYKRMTEEEISKEIGSKVSEVDDKLLNILLLQKMSGNKSGDMIDAAIDQKAKSLQGIPFHLSATIKKGLRFIRYAGIFIVLVMLMGMTFPDLFNYGTKRVVYYNSEIEAPPPFRFNLLSDLKAIRNETFEVKVKITGEVLPASLYVKSGEKLKKATKVTTDEFSYSLSNVTQDFSFVLLAEGEESKEYLVEVLNRPSISDFSLDINYPPYLELENQGFKNVGNISIPDGSKVTWSINVKDGEYLHMNFDSKRKDFSVTNDEISFDSTFRTASSYSIGAGHSNGLRSDSINYRISIVQDQYPSIEVYEAEDSLNGSTVFIGGLNDDYGLSQFRFGYSLNGGEVNYENLDLGTKKNNWDFIYEIDWKLWDVKKGDEVVYFFEVWDNDGVNGPKSSRSQNMMFKLLDESEIEKNKEELADKIEGEMEEAIMEAKKLKKDIEELQKDMVEDKNLDWSSKKRIEDLMQRNESLKKQLNQINENNKQKNKFEKNLKHSDEINRKREELERLMEDILDDETLEKLKELEKLMDKLRKEDIQKAMDEIEISNEMLEKELDRSLELFKQLEFENQLEKVSEKLDELAEEQEELRNKTEQGKKDEKLAEEQKELKEKLEDWEKEKEKLDKMNDELENKHDVKKEEENINEAKEEMTKAEEELKKGKNKKAGENQKSAEQKMEEMKDNLNALQMAMQAQSMEDIQSLRNTLENLIEISFQQESIMAEMKGLRSDDPRFNETTKEQRSILEGMKVVEDSLNALSKRIVQIEPMINRETSTAKLEMERSMKSMTERKLGNVSRHQQLAMTSVNNLAVLLDEVVNQLQQQMMSSSGQCKKPGSQKPSSSSMKAMQKQLNKQLEEMKKMKEKGKKPGEGEGEGQQSAESLAKMAAEQAKIREELRKMSENSNQKDSKELKKIGEMMEETERDIVNRQITQETILRQEKILTKLLESENAERQQDMEERREAVAGKEKKNGNLFDVKEYYKARYNNHEELIKENISFNRYYKTRVKEYFKIISQ